MDMHFTKLILDNESQEMWIQALKNHESKGDVDESTLEEAQKLVPHEYWDYLDVFSKLKSECMCNGSVFFFLSNLRLDYILSYRT